MKKPTDAELEVLQVLWEHGPKSVRFVNEELSKNRKVVYTTTLKMMQVMTEKGFLERDTSQRTHLYKAIVSEQKIQQTLTDKLLKTVFKGSPLKLVVNALGHKKTSPEDLEEIKKIIQELEKKKKWRTPPPFPGLKNFCILSKTVFWQIHLFDVLTNYLMYSIPSSIPVTYNYNWYPGRIYSKTYLILYIAI